MKNSIRFVFVCKVLFFNFFFCTMICSLVQAQTGAEALSEALSRFKNHINGVSVLSKTQINEQAIIVEKNIALIGQNGKIISEAFEIVKLYEIKEGPLFINSRTKSGISQTNHTNVELDWAMFEIQQGILDFACTMDNIKLYSTIFKGAKFETSRYFPGDVAAPSDPNTSYQVNVNCSMPAVWGVPVMYSTQFARRPTGCYLAPGSIVTVTVPTSIINKGFKIRVGAHSWDLVAKPTCKRLNRVSLVYPINSAVTQIANPLGGGIYIEVPYEANNGILSLEITNAVRSPFFSARSFDKTSLSNWQNVERKYPGPWADFESDKFMMQVPTSWIYNFDDPVTLMQDWDKGLDAVSELFGQPMVRNITVLYLQIDVLMRGSANFPGYPQSNYPYNPTTIENGNKNHFTLRGPQYSDYATFHELGHSQLFTKFSGETEAAVNVPYIAMQNKKFGMSLDDAFGNSFGMPQVSLDQAAIMWMVTANFRNGKPMDISNSESNEVRYQHRGYGKYVEIVRLFGWDSLSKFWSSVQQDYLNGITYPTNTDPTDNRILRMSKAAGADLTPLIHFWGIQPDNLKDLKASIAAAELQPSDLIYDMLEHYKTIIPMNNKEFLAHSKILYPKGLTPGASPLYGEGWYYTWAPIYNESHGIAAKNALQNIINLYFPNGRPNKIVTFVSPYCENLDLIYPNPASTDLNINCQQPVQQIDIIDFTGKAVRNINYNKNHIDISGLIPGIYFIKLRSKDATYVKKFIKI